jgi:hypothetical protein
MKNELVKVLASDYGLEETKASEVKAMFVPMLEKMESLEGEYNDILKEEINPETCQRAKDLRLTYVKVRTKTAEIHKELKAFYLNGGRFIDAWKNAQAMASGEKEQTLKSIEDHFENLEKVRIEKLRLDRENQLKVYTEIMPLALGHMEQDVFDNYLAGVKLAYETRIAAEKKADEDRIAKEKKDAEEREAQRLENIRLKADAEEKERLAEIERKIKARRNEELRPYIIFIRDYSKMISLEEKEYQKEFKDIQRAAKEHYEFEAKENQRKQKEKDDLLKKADAEKKKRERLEAEIEKKRIDELKAKRDAELKIENERKAQVAAEKKAKLAPDKTKLLNFMQDINDLPRPDVKSIEAGMVAQNANTMLVQAAKYILDNASKL